MRVRYFSLVISLLGVPAIALAQSPGEGLAHMVPNLILRGITLPGASDPGRPHAGHFTLGDPRRGGSQELSRPDVAAIAAVEAFGDRLQSQFAIVPLGSSTGGFTYTFDTSSGLYTRNSASFGPAYTERARTVGRRKLSVGANYQHTSFDTFAGENLRDRSITFYLPHTDCCNATTFPPPSPQAPGFEGDLVEAALELEATGDTFAFFANYGVTERLDVGLSVPITRVSLQADVRARIIRLSTSATPLVHTFTEGVDDIVENFSNEGSATGLGDVVLRGKYNFWQVGDTGIAAAVDLRLPTGNEDELLGVGTTQAKFFLVLSSGGDRFSPHVNLGYTVSGKGSHEAQLAFEPLGASDEFNYATGIELVAHPRVTVLADFLGRTLMDAGDIGMVTRTYPFRVGAGADPSAPLLVSESNPLTGEAYRQMALQPGNLTQLLGSTGVKFNAAPNLLVAAHVLFPLSQAGLRDRMSFAFGVDYAF